MLKGVIRHVDYLGDGHDLLECLTCYRRMPGVVDQYSPPLWENGPICFCPYCGIPIFKFVPQKPLPDWYDKLSLRPEITREYVIQRLDLWIHKIPSHNDWEDEEIIPVTYECGHAMSIKVALKRKRAFTPEKDVVFRVIVRNKNGSSVSSRRF